MISDPEDAFVHPSEFHRAEVYIPEQTIASLGKSVSPSWGKDQKDASLAAMITLPVQMT